MAAERAIRETSRALAEIDVASALAELAANEDYVRPKVDTSLAFEIEGGRHPVVEQALRADGAELCRQRLRSGAEGYAGRDPPSPREGEGGCGAAG